ncbi:MAG TPA: Eco57I restriction-modification methylase domain-containing protein [Flavobacteriales bacterium]|nr:Eco57I restriction-modification methylase domain-containing protein [Flavobacteriales bacterium]
MTGEQLTLLDRSELLELVRPLGPIEDGDKHGAVYTKAWVVDLMLDLANYRSERDLALVKLLEPACGDGAFLLRIVQRLSRSLRANNRPLSDARNAIRAYDLQADNVRTARERVVEFLVTDGWTGADAIVEHWIRHADFLLAADEIEFDLVIGNPPYIRAQEIPEARRNAYIGLWNTMTMGTDIFVGFIEKGLRSLKAEGRLCYIVADRWQHNAYGRKLRKLISQQFAVDAMFEMHGVDAFAAPVSAYPAITQIRRGAQGRVLYASAAASFDPAAADRLRAWSGQAHPPALQDRMFSACVLPCWFRTEEIWPSGSPEVLAFLEDMVERFHPLEDPATGTKVGIGIASGADDAFFTQQVDHGFAQLNQFTALLKEALDEGQQITLQVRGYASPLAKSDYNKNLSLRRIATLVHYLERTDHGALLPYLNGTATNGGQLVVVKQPFGKSTADASVSDRLDDLQHSVYGVGAAMERRIEIEQVE